VSAAPSSGNRSTGSRPSGNDTLEDFQNLLLPDFQHVYSIGLLKSVGKRKRYKSHKELVAILKNGTPGEFREGMRKHLENHFARILENND